MNLATLTITIRGQHDTGKTTVAALIKSCLEENGFQKVTLKDIPPLLVGQKPDFATRLRRNQTLRPVNIVVELEK